MEASVIGSRITKFRKAKGMTQEELGRAVGVSTQAVSRWECGGAPDITLLPAIADHLGVSVDALFGREGGEAMDIDKAVWDYFYNAPRKTFLDKLNWLVWVAINGAEGITNSHDQVTYKNKALDSMGRIMCSVVQMKQGIYFGVNGDDMSFSAICPKPEDGYRAHFGDRELLRRLYAVLGTPGCLEMLEHMLSQEVAFFSPELIAQKSELSVENAMQLLEKLEEFRIVQPWHISMPEGIQKVYQIRSDGSYIPFIYLTRCISEGRYGNYLQIVDNDLPLF